MERVDLILKSNNIFTGLSNSTISGHVVIKGNKLVEVGSVDVGKYESEEVLDCGDKLIVPGFIDAHVHYFMGAISSSEHICTEISSSRSEEECLRIMKRYADDHPKRKRIIGIGWSLANWKDGPLPTKHSLDSIISDRPVYLIAADVHTFWLNSKALEESRITDEWTPRSGSIGKFDDGEFNGLLFEPDAFAPAMSKVMDLDAEIKKKAHKAFLSHINSWGVTTISDMSADDYNETTYQNYSIIKEMEAERSLTCRINLYSKLEAYTDFSEANRLQTVYASDKLRLGGVKGFIDGVTSTYTGLLIEPYTDKPETCGIGVPNFEQEIYEKSIIAANKAGLSVRLHCIADGSVRMALDIFEKSLMLNGNCGITNTIEHIENIHPSDIPRFAELGVIPSMQPYHLTLDLNEKISRIGKERCRWEWPHKTILESGGKLAFGTDYPVVDFNPFLTIHSAVTRLDDSNKPTGINPEECISLAEAIRCYTKNAAKAYNRNDIGVLKKGKLADVVVIDRNLFDINPHEIKNASVELTIMDGKIVYRA